MNRSFVIAGVLFGVAASVFTYAGSSSADTTVVEPPAPFQGLGALTTVAGFLSPEHHELLTADLDKPTLHIAPASVASGYGVAAFGSF